MYLLYTLLLTIAFIALFPYFAYRALFSRKYTGNLKERLGFVPASNNAGATGSSANGSTNRPVIWFHAVSVGEVMAIRPLIKAVRTHFPDYRLIVSTTTVTGQAVARAQLAEAGDAVGFCFFPFDWQFAVRRSMNRIRPHLVVLVESELWPNFLKLARARGVDVLLANGRISDRTFKRLIRWKRISRFLYENVSLFAMQSEVDANRARELGARNDSVVVAGNLKYDIVDSAKSQSSWAGIDGALLLIAGSTSEGEEEIILEAFAQLRNHPVLGATRVLIAPRHPERFEKVADLIRASGFSLARRSQADNAQDAQALLLDTVGELASLYRLATLVFVGGSLVPRGGHNILEPAIFARPLIVGPHMENFREMTSDFLARDALVQLEHTERAEQASELGEIFEFLLSNPARARTLGENARRAVDDNRGATEKHLAAIARLLNSR